MLRFRHDFRGKYGCGGGGYGGGGGGAAVTMAKTIVLNGVEIEVEDEDKIVFVVSVLNIPKKKSLISPTRNAVPLSPHLHLLPSFYTP
ncbi:hypothetical protein RIF29_40412 [Crotalaria pallida]|uniref:Uncharacterized protein n=1 Tax=Crotalaria pallida TaxID=3830 RepID=A0AAN9HNF7_CROPI